MMLSPAQPTAVAVADGLGGHPAGAVASRVALTHIAAISTSWTTLDSVQAGLEEVNHLVRTTAATGLRTAGMATTVAGIMLGLDTVLCFNVGDSRVYRITDGYTEQISIDDAILGPEGEATGRVTQVLGSGPDAPFRPHVAELPVESGVRFLICSDGLTGPVSRHEIRQLCHEQDLLLMITALTRAAHQAGAPDNVSIIGVELP
jgi:protein phosphatase